jgi:hypothetical protein
MTVDPWTLSMLLERVWSEAEPFGRVAIDHFASRAVHARSTPLFTALTRNRKKAGRNGCGAETGSTIVESVFSTATRVEHRGKLRQPARATGLAESSRNSAGTIRTPR